LKKVFRTIGYILAGFLVLLLSGVVFIYIYFVKHKKDLILKSQTEIGNKIKASVTIDNAGINWFADFPSVSIELDNVKIVDSSNIYNRDPFLTAAKLFINCDIFQIIKGNFQINHVEVSNGFLNFNRDKSGASNLHILDAETPSNAPQSPRQTLFDEMTLKNIRILITDISKQKKIDLLVNKLKCNPRFEDALTIFYIDMHLHINSLGFNTYEGSYGDNKNLEGNFRVFLDSKRELLSILQITLLLDKEPVKAEGIFHLDTAKKFHLQISAPFISYKNAVTSLLDTTQKILKIFNVNRPLSISADLSGTTKYGTIPKVNIEWSIKDAQISTPAGIFSHASMKGFFNNELVEGKPRKDPNSQIIIADFDGLWNGNSLVHCTRMVMNNLVDPNVHFDLQANCRLTDVDSLVGSDAVSFENGNAAINIDYDGPIVYKKNVVPKIYGDIILDNAEIRYNPRNLSLTNGSGTIRFNGTKVLIEKISSRFGKTSLTLNGEINSIVPLFYKTQSELLLQWTLSSPSINLTELIPLLQNRKQVHRVAQKSKMVFSGVSKAIDDFAEKCNIRAAFIFNKLNYKTFEASNVHASMVLNNNQGWVINNLSLEHAGGTIKMNGALTQEDNNEHHFSIHTTITNADVSKVFYSFNNFGIHSFDYSNIRGKVNAVSELEVELDDKAELLPNSIKGTTDFYIEKGELINFKPIEAACQKIFPERNFHDIKFDVLKDHVSYQNYILKLDKMEITSNLLHFYIEGLYGLNNKGTDLIIQVPVNNIQKPKLDESPENIGLYAKTGLSVYIHAADNGNGDIAFKYSLSEKPGKQKATATKKKHPGIHLFGKKNKKISKETNPEDKLTD
jgi:hypothetical protein